MVSGFRVSCGFLSLYSARAPPHRPGCFHAIPHTFSLPLESSSLPPLPPSLPLSLPQVRARALMNKVCQQVEKATGAMAAFDGSRLLFMSAPIPDAPVRACGARDVAQVSSPFLPFVLTCAFHYLALFFIFRHPLLFPFLFFPDLVLSLRPLSLSPAQLILGCTLSDDDVERFLGESTAAPAPVAAVKPGAKGAAAAAATAAAAAAAAAATSKEFSVRFAPTSPCEVPLAPLVQARGGGRAVLDKNIHQQL